MITSFENLQIVKLPPNSDLEKQYKQNWTLSPMYLPQKDIKNANKFLNMISNVEIYTPCSQAKISKDTVKKFLILSTIDDLFYEAVMEYEKDLKIALVKDQKIAKAQRHYSKEDFIDAVGMGVRKGGKMGNIGYIWLATIPIGMLLGGLYGCTDRVFYQYTGKKINLERSVNRVKWLQTVSIKEDLLIKKQTEMIEWRILVLKQELEELDPNLVNTEFVEEMEVLDQVGKVLSPNMPILIDGMSVLKYLEKYSWK